MTTDGTADTLATRLDIHEVDSTRWPDLVRLFEGRGGPGHCWCLVWRESTAVRSGLDLAGRRAAMQRRVEAGVPVGLLAYINGEPIGWCSVAPRETFRPLGTEPLVAGEHVWSVVCFFVQRPHRNSGVARALLAAAIATAKAHGADVIEATPVDLDSPSYHFMGFRPLFLAAGFDEVGTAGTRRHVMRRAVAT